MELSSVVLVSSQRSSSFINFSSFFCGQRRMRVCVCVVNKCVMFPSFVGNGMKLTRRKESNLSAVADRSVDFFESSIRNIV